MSKLQLGLGTSESRGDWSDGDEGSLRDCHVDVETFVCNVVQALERPHGECSDTLQLRPGSNYLLAKLNELITLSPVHLRNPRTLGISDQELAAQPGQQIEGRGARTGVTVLRGGVGPYC